MPRDDRQRPAHQPPRRLEDQHDQHRADDEVGRGQEAGAPDQVGVEHPVVEAGGEAERRRAPRTRPCRRGVVAFRLASSAEAEQQQEADMHGPHDLARQRAVGGGAELEEREGDGDAEGDACRQARPQPGGRPSVGISSRGGAAVSRASRGCVDSCNLGGLGPAPPRGERSASRRHSPSRGSPTFRAGSRTASGRLPCSSARRPDAAAPACRRAPWPDRSPWRRRARRPAAVEVLEQQLGHLVGGLVRDAVMGDQEVADRRRRDVRGLAVIGAGRDRRRRR